MAFFLDDIHLPEVSFIQIIIIKYPKNNLPLQG